MKIKRLLLASLAIILFASITKAQTIPSYVPTNGLQAWYSFNGNGNDLSTNANNATNYGATFVADRNGVANAAASFNGTNQYLKVDAPGFTFSETGTFTFSLWINRQTPTGSGVTIMHGSTLGGNFIWNFQGKSDSRFGTNMQQSTWIWAICQHSLNVWDHYVGTYDNKIMNLYKNGVFETTATYTHSGAASVTLPLYIGKGVSGNNYKGEIDDIGIWDRVLTQQEITELLSCDLNITTQPSDQNVKVNDNATFSCTVTPYPSYFQWQKFDGSVYQDLTNTGQYSGTDSEILTVWVVTMANNQDAFRCIMGVGTCIDTSDIAYLNVCGEITSQPSDLTVNINNDAQFIIESSDPAAAFQWQIHDQGVYQDLLNTGQYSGANNDTLIISNTTMANNATYYRCITMSGTCTDSSHTVQLTVDDNVGIAEPSNQDMFSVYPNPVNTKITVKANKALIGSEYKILNQVGKQLLNGKIHSDNTIIDLSNLPVGVYMISVGEIPEHTMKILKR